MAAIPGAEVMNRLPSNAKIAQLVVDRFSNESRRRQVLTGALEARAEIVATRRQLREAYLQLGVNIHARMKSDDLIQSDKLENLDGEFDLTSLKVRIDGLLAELEALEEEFKVSLEPTHLDGG